MTFGPQMGKPVAPETPVTLSSLQTFFMKFVLPTAWIGGFMVGNAAVFLSPNSGPAPAYPKWSLLLPTVIGVVLIWWICMRLKRVRMDSQSLYISNYATEIVVPLREVAEVTENVWINIHPVTIKFRRETFFGSQIVFMPTQRWFAFWSSHPVVAEIRSAVARAGGDSYGRVGT